VFDDLEKLLRCFVYERILESSREVYGNGSCVCQEGQFKRSWQCSYAERPNGTMLAGKLDLTISL
jgi:hypothetical protein